MASPNNSAQNRVIDPINSNVARGYKDPQFVGMHLFPAVPVQVAGGRVIEFGKEAFRRYNTRRAPGSSTKRVQFGHQGDPYALTNHRLEGVVPREFQRDASRVPGIDLATRAIRNVQTIQTRELEIEQAELARDANNYDNNHKVTLVGSAQWSHADAKPATQVREYRQAIRASIGVYPNVLLLGAAAFDAAAENPAVLERTKYTSSDSITAEMLAKQFGVEKVVVGEGVYATDDDAADFVDIWGNDGILAYVPAGADGTTYAPGSGSLNMEQPSFAYTYVMEGHPLVEKPYWDNNTASWIYPVAYERAPVLAGMAAAFLIKDITG
ncbi:MAG: major capsid protein [Bacteroidota bacterium]